MSPERSRQSGAIRSNRGGEDSDIFVSAPYSREFKEEMIRKMASPRGPSANALAGEVGVSQGTLSRWLREANTVPTVPRKKKKGRETAPRTDRSRPGQARRPQDWSPEEKMRVLREAEGLAGEELGALLRREGLHEAQLAQWRQAAEEAALQALGGRKQRSAEQKRIRSLEREVKRKDKALAEAAALLVLQKKVRALWADEDDDTTPGSDE